MTPAFVCTLASSLMRIKLTTAFDWWWSVVRLACRVYGALLIGGAHRPRDDAVAITLHCSGGLGFRVLVPGACRYRRRSWRA